MILASVVLNRKQSRFSKPVLRTDRILLVIVVLTIISNACSGQSPNGAAKAIENYFTALIQKNSSQLVNASCASWEANARQELRTFDAVQVSLQDLQCNALNSDKTNATIACAGKIVANYGNEILEINLADRNYLAVKESGEWRMCGYP
jgi:hypothetical protein